MAPVILTEDRLTREKQAHLLTCMLCIQGGVEHSVEKMLVERARNLCVLEQYKLPGDYYIFAEHI